MHYIIIGGGIAGITAAKTVRNKDADAEITIISSEKIKPYYRPMIPLLIERLESEIEISYVEDIEKDYNINLLFDAVTGIDTESRDVSLESGGGIGFDKLLIAAGSTPLNLDIPGVKGPGVFTLRTKEDALKIKSALSDTKNAAIIGGGFVGIKAATALRKTGINVTIIEELGQILYQKLDGRGAEIISLALKQNGINIITGETISEIIRDGEGLNAVKLGSGSVINADIVIMAVGVRPDTDIFSTSKIKTDRGVLVNELLQTNVPEIYAAGDVVEYKNLLTGRPSVSGLWSNAEEMGRIAGANMAGAKIKYSGFLTVMNATEIEHIPLITTGIIEPEDKGYETFIEDNKSGYRKLVFKGDIPVGAIFIGNIENAGIYTNLIKNHIPIGELKEQAIEGRLEYISFITCPK